MGHRHAALQQTAIFGILEQMDDVAGKVIIDATNAVRQALILTIPFTIAWLKKRRPEWSSVLTARVSKIC